MMQSRAVLPFSTLLMSCLMACGDEPATEAGLLADGTVSVEEGAIPYSEYASVESQEWLQLRVNGPGYGSALSFRSAGADLDAYRERKDQGFYKPLLEKQLQRYPSQIEEGDLAGLRIFSIQPESGVPDDNEPFVLINLHGGSYVEGSGYAQQIESVPVATAAKMRVVSIDYPLAPESSYPYAVEQIVRAYRELLKDFNPQQIGMFGSSAGGALVGQVAAHLVSEELPLPGALAVLNDGWGAPFGAGDGAYTSHLLNGRVAPGLIGDIEAQLDRVVYFDGVNPGDPLAFPMTSETIYAEFPPTLFISGSRAHEVSNAAEAHIKLSLAGVESQLFVWDGQEHLFPYNSDLPEAREAYELIGLFFSRNLQPGGGQDLP